MAADLEALRDYYGSSAFTGNKIYGFNANISSSVSAVMADLQLYADETSFCIIDDGGTDTVDFSGYAPTRRSSSPQRQALPPSVRSRTLAGKKAT